VQFLTPYIERSLISKELLDKIINELLDINLDYSDEVELELIEISMSILE